MKKGFVTILALCAAAVLVLTACGQSTTEPAKEETTTAEATTVEETTAAEETTEDTTEDTTKDTAADGAAAVEPKEIAEADEEVEDGAETAKDGAAEDVKAEAMEKVDLIAGDVEKIIEDVKVAAEDVKTTAEEVKTSVEDQSGETISSFSDFISTIGKSDTKEIFDLIADTIDGFANGGERSPVGNVVRSLGNLVNTIINGGEVDAESSEMVAELIMDEDSLSQMSDGMILDMYLASKDELIQRGVIK